MQKRLRLLKANGGDTARPSVESNEYCALVRHAQGRLLSQAEREFSDRCRSTHGGLYLPERAPYGQYGYVLYRVADDHSTLLLGISNPFHGLQLPIAWANRHDAQTLADQLSCHYGYGSKLCLDAAAVIKAGATLRFGNQGAQVLLARTRDNSPAVTPVP